MSKRSGQQCKKAALRGKSVCAFHGGKSTGPKTAEGRHKIAQAHLIHGNDTGIEREQASQSAAYMRELEDVAWALQMMAGPRTRGRKPKSYVPIKTLEDAKLWIFLNINGLRGKVKF